MRRVLLEALLAAVCGTAFAFAANALSPRGLRLARDYFPTAAAVPAPATIATPPASTGGTNLPAQTTTAAPEFRVNEKGLQMIGRAQAVALFEDPRAQLDLVVFVDARNDEHYREGHIPGAYHFDPYRPEQYLAGVLPVCQAADQVVVYCTGGDCEDSQFAAIGLRNAGIANPKLFVYEGGMNDWSTNGQPVETGARKSGVFRTQGR